MQILAKANFQITLKTTPITSNYQENNLLYLICLHDIELPRIQPLSLVFMPDLDNRVIFVNGVMGLEVMDLEGKATCPKSQAGTWYRPGFQLILMSPRLVFFILLPTASSRKPKTAVSLADIESEKGLKNKNDQRWPIAMRS